MQGAFDTSRIPLGYQQQMNVDKERQRINIYDVPNASTSKDCALERLR